MAASPDTPPPTTAICSVLVFSMLPSAHQSHNISIITGTMTIIIMMMNIMMLVAILMMMVVVLMMVDVMVVVADIGRVSFMLIAFVMEDDDDHLGPSKLHHTTLIRCTLYIAISYHMISYYILPYHTLETILGFTTFSELCDS